MKYLTLFLALLVSSLFVVSASTTYHNDSIENKYSIGEKLRGFLNISFSNVKADALVETGWGSKVGLKYLLDASHYSSGVNYTCTPGSCLTGYNNENALQSVALNDKNFTLGFVVQGSGVSNADINLLLTGNSGGSCSPTLSVDFGNMGTTKLTSTNATAYVCSLKYGCFEQNRNDYTSVDVPWASSYCERINVSAAPALKIGANLTNSTIGAPGLTVKLYDLAGGAPLAACDLPNFTKTSESLECLIKYSNPSQKEYLACIQAKGNSNYKIRAEINAPCGTNNFGGTYPIDYEIFVKSLAFGNPVVNITKDTFFAATGKNLAEFIATYIETNYGACTPNCIIPFKLSGKSQQVNVVNAKIRYDIDGAQGVESTQVYNLSVKSAVINSGQLLLNISAANFTIPETDGKNLVLRIDGSDVLSRRLNISTTFSFDITPTLATYGQETVFFISASNISTAKWDFGDATPIQTSSGNSTKHTYTKQGTFTVSVEATKKDGQTSKRIFEVGIGNVKDAVNSTLIKYRSNLKTLEGNLSGYPTWLKTIVYAQVNFTSLNSSLNKLNEQYLNVTDDNESQYSTIFSNLIALKIPQSIDTGKKGSLTLLSGADTIDTSYVSRSSGKTYDETALRGAIVSWMLKNYDSMISFESMDFDYSTSKQTFATKFKIETKPKTTVTGDNLFLSYPLDAITFANAYGAKAAGSGTMIPLSPGNQVFEFVILEDISVDQLGAYISPAISSLGDLSSVSLTCNADGVCDSGENSNCSDCKKTYLPYVLAILVLLLGVGAYFGLRWWYSKYYEQKLFKNRQDLFNIITFILNSKRSKISDSEIKKKLKAAGWSSEKIDYAFHKIDSKPAGDVRFIKRQ